MATQIKADALIADFRHMLDNKWGYIPGASGQMWTKADQEKKARTDAGVAKYGAKWIGHRVADCSGAFVWAYRQHGLSIYHGSNRIARAYVTELLPASAAQPGMAALKARKPGDQLYQLPDEYKPGGKYYNGDLNDYYHIGLVDGDPRYVLNAQGVRTGFVRSKTEDNWPFVARLKNVVYEEGPDMQVLYQAVVTAENGKPVNLRKGPSQNAARIRTVPVGAEVDVLNETDDAWAEIRCDGQTGYMMRRYLRRIGDETDDLSQRVARARTLLQQALELLDDGDAIG